MAPSYPSRHSGWRPFIAHEEVGKESKDRRRLGWGWLLRERLRERELQVVQVTELKTVTDSETRRRQN